MTTTLRYNYRMYPTKSQGRSLLQICGAQRWIWNTFLAKEMEEYKAELEGKHVSVISKWFPSTKTCSSCGVIKDKKLSERLHSCDDCGLVLSRDHNAAINILNQVISELHRAGTARIYASGDVTCGELVHQTKSSNTSLNEETTLVLD